MNLGLAHSKLDVYLVAGELIVECYSLVKLLPPEERFNLTQQIKRAALSVKLNIAEGSSRRTLADRRRFFEIARSSVVEIEAAFEVCERLEFLRKDQLSEVYILMLRCYQMLSKMIR